MHVVGGSFDERRNTSRVWPVSPLALKDALAALAALRRNDPALVRWIEDGHPTLTETEHLTRFGEPYSRRPRRVAPE